jgi:hypothetical protein
VSVSWAKSQVLAGLVLSAGSRGESIPLGFSQFLRTTCLAWLVTPSSTLQRDRDIALVLLVTTWPSLT